MRLPVAAVLATLILAGCVTPPASLDKTSVSVDASAAMAAVRTLMKDVPCDATVDPAATSANLLQLGQHHAEEGNYGEIDARGDIILAARDGLGGIDVINVSDPASPKLTGSLHIDNTSGLDVQWIPGMDGAVIGSGKKLFVVDLKDLSAPEVVAVAEVATQAHMVELVPMGDQVYAYVASQTTNAPAFIYQMEGWNFTLKGSFSPFPAGISHLPLGDHDITFVNDTKLGKPMLYVAEGLGGWSAWTLDDPLKPARVAWWPAPEPGIGYTHTIRVGFFGDKRIVVTIMEVGQNTLKVYDASDLSKPVLLGRWNADPKRPHIPEHNIQLHGDTLYLAHYTEGMYVFNLSAVIDGPPILGTAALQPAAHYAVTAPGNGGALGFANAWDVVLVDGVVYLSQLDGTLTSIGYGCIAPGDITQWASA
jgi:hypothetical protein